MSPNSYAASNQQVSTKLLTDLSGTLMLIFGLIPALIYAFLFFTGSPITQQEPSLSSFYQFLQICGIITFVAGILMLIAALQILATPDEKILRTIPSTHAWGRSRVLKGVAAVWEFCSDALMAIPYGIAKFGKSEEGVDLTATSARRFLIIQAILSGIIAVAFNAVYNDSWFPFNPVAFLTASWTIALVTLAAGAFITKQLRTTDR